MPWADSSAEEHRAHSNNSGFEVGESIWKDSPPSSFSTEETTYVFSRSCIFQEPQSTTSRFPQGHGKSEHREVGIPQRQHSSPPSRDTQGTTLCSSSAV